MKVCILGGGGCFGLNTARYLMSLGIETFGIGRSPLRGPEWSMGLERPDSGYRYFAHHITHELDYVMARLDAERPDVIVNYAAQGEGAASFNPDDYWRFYETNSMALARLVGQLARRDWCPRFIHIGTSELYGSVTEPAPETAPIVPTSPYAASKAAFDMHLLSISKVSGFPMNIVRPSNCYTPGQQLHRIIPKAMLYALTGRRLPLHGGGRAEKSYLHATDLSGAISIIIHAGMLGEVYNVGPEKPTSIRDVVQMCADRFGIPFEQLCEVTGDRTGQDSRYWLDSGKVRALGWEPEIGWRDGLSDMVAWLESYLDVLGKQPTDFRMRA